jgi:hypothetical protein
MPFETTTAICSILMGGLLEKYPKLRLAFAHGREVDKKKIFYCFIFEKVEVHFHLPLVVLIMDMNVDRIYVHIKILNNHHLILVDFMLIHLFMIPVH